MSAAPNERIDKIVFDLHSLSVILGFALDKLAGSSLYGSRESQDGAMMCDVGQVLIDTRQRLADYGNALEDIGIEIGQPPASQ